MIRTLVIFSIFYLSVTSVFSQSFKFEWVATIGDTNRNTYFDALTSDNSGNVISAGRINDSIDFDPDTGKLVLGDPFLWSGYLQKLGPTKNLLWAMAFPYVYFQDLTTDNKDNVYATGYFFSTTDFDPDTTDFLLTPSGFNDAFVLKLDQNGKFLWAIRIGGNQVVYGRNIEVDIHGNVLTSGVFEGSTDFDPSASMFSITAKNQSDIYIQKLDSNGSFLWAKSFGTKIDDIVSSITIDQAGSIYSCGPFFDSIRLNPSNPSILTPTTNLNSDFYVQKLDANGNFAWAYGIGGSGTDDARSVHSSGRDIFVTGKFSSKVDFDPDTSTSNLDAGNFQNAFILNLDTSGNFEWVRSIQGSSDGNDISVDQNHNVVSIGTYAGQPDFDPSVEQYYLFGTSNSFSGLYVHKMDSAGNFITAHRASSSYSYLSRLSIDPLQNVFIGNGFGRSSDFDPSTKIHTVNSKGNPDAFVLKLGPCAPDVDVDTVKACDSYTWINNKTYKSNGIFFDINANSNNCDSIHKLILTVNYSDSIITKKTACSSYTWIDGITYTQNTVTSFTLPNSKGCDSIRRLELKINGPRTGVTKSYSSLFAQEGDATYQWLDCDDKFTPIQGETNRLFQPTKNGNYALAVNKNNCLDTSECVSITTLNVDEFLNSNISIYPNPVNNEMHIESKDIRIKEILIQDASGRLVYTNSDPEKSIRIILNEAPGIYILHLKTSEGDIRKKIVKR